MQILKGIECLKEGQMKHQAILEKMDAILGEIAPAWRMASSYTD